MLNTYAQAAPKFGWSVSKLKKEVYAGRVGVRHMGHRTKLIPDSEIDRVIQQRTQKATA